MEYQDIHCILPQEIYAAHLTAINSVRLSKREIDILSCILNGRSPKGIGHFLSISPRTVEVHIRNAMQKLDCTSRESMVKLIEETDSFLILKDYYLKLLTYSAFEKLLKDIATLDLDKIPVVSCLIVYWKEKNYAFFKNLKEHLNLIGISVILERREKPQLVSQLIQEGSHDSFTIYAVSSSLKEDQEISSQHGETAEDLAQNSPQGPSKILFLLSGKVDQKELPEKIMGYPYVVFTEQKNYYFLVFCILKKILPNLILEEMITAFEERYYKLDKTSDPVSNQILPGESLVDKEEAQLKLKAKQFLRKRWYYILPGILMISLGVAFPIFLQSNQGAKENKSNHLIASNRAKIMETSPHSFVRSDLIVPAERSILHRSELISQIDNTFKGNDRIQTTALVGIGGAGKTTLARQYAHQQKAPVIWEINAETPENLKASFEDLAQEVSKTEEDQKILRVLLDIKNPEEKEKKILSFVKDHLRASPNWFLIFDNVEKFTDIQNYFPQDSSIWGLGKILLTTRDRNIQNNSRVNHVVPIEELTQKQKLNLFTKIMNHGTNPLLASIQHTELEKFLENIPPFPLDVSVAAYYLKSTNISYEDYLENLKNYDNEFSGVQENLLKEAGTYLKTRYGIITLSLEHLIKSHKDFGDLLLLISLLDTQNIPKDLLDKHKSKLIVDKFIYHLKKYSLITADASGVSSEPIFSIHRSTQVITLNYLTKKLDLLKNDKILQEICDTFVKYSVDAIDKGGFLKQKHLLNHCIALLSHKNLLTDFMKTSISGELGGLYCHQGFYVKAKAVLEKIIQAMDKKYPILHAHISIYLGKIYSSNGNYEKAKVLFENNLSIYSKYKENNLDLPKTLTRLGILYRKTGDYKKAKISLERALNFFKAHLPENHASVLWASINLGSIYLDQGEFEKSRILLEQNLRSYKQYLPENHAAASEILQRLGVIYRDLGYYEKAIKLFQLSLDAQFCLKNYNQALSESHLHMAGPLADLASVYIELNNYEKAKKLLEKSLNIYRKHVSENHVYAALALRYLGNAHAGLKNYQTAKDYLQKNLKIYEDQYGETHLKTAYILRDLGRVYLLENHIEIAEKLLGRALGAFQKHKHPEIYTCLERLSDLYLKKSEIAIHHEDTEGAQRFKTQAIGYLRQALEVVKTCFPADSPHGARIKLKIKELEQG